MSDTATADRPERHGGTNPAQPRRRRVARADAPRDARGPQPRDGRAARPRPALERRGCRRRGPRGARGGRRLGSALTDRPHARRVRPPRRCSTSTARSWPSWSRWTWARRSLTRAARSAAGIESVEAACGLPHVLKGESLTGVAQGVDVDLIRQPVGVVAAITPFNFPAMIPLWFLPYAIATGNTFILKPSEQDPLAGERIVELAQDGQGDTRRRDQPRPRRPRRGQRPARAPRHRRDLVRRLGGDRPPRRLTAAAHGKRVQALGGAKNSMVVMPDADPDADDDRNLQLRLRSRGAALPGRLDRGRWSATAASRTARWT